MNDDAEIVTEFLVESHENLDQLDRDLVELEQTPDSRELLSSIFRTIHTIKGTSGFLAFGRLEQLTHHGEDLLSRLRDREMTMSNDVAEVLLRMVDTVRALLDSIETSSVDTDPSVPVEDVVVLLARVLAGEPLEADAPADAPAAAEVIALAELEEAPEPAVRARAPAGDAAAAAGSSGTHERARRRPGARGRGGAVGG